MDKSCDAHNVDILARITEKLLPNDSTWLPDIPFTSRYNYSFRQRQIVRLYVKQENYRKIL